MDNLNARAEIEVVVKGLDQAVASFERLYEQTGEKQFDKYGRSVARVSGQLKGMGTEAKGTASATGTLATATVGATAAQVSSNKAVDEAIGRLPRLRYALYDVASTANITALGITAVGTAAVVAAARYESAFTNVERTLEPGSIAVGKLREQLVGLSNEMPVAFVDLSKIATLGNQLGVPAEQIAEFTELVAKFSTVSGMTAEASAQAFGRLGNILGLKTVEDMSRLASAVELVGVRSAATDQQIIALSERLGASATRAGFTADQVVGLAGALGSLGVAPERAQGVFETYFNSLNDSLSEGGEKLEAFAAITGRTVADLNDAVRRGDGFAVFQDFISGLQGADTVQLTGALDMLGLSGLRANEVIGRIAQRMPLLEQSFNVAAQGARENTELNRQYALILDDLASKWQMFINKLTTFSATIGQTVLPVVGGLLDMLGDMLMAFTEFASTPLGGEIVRSAVGFAALAAAVLGVVGAVALSGAALAAMRTALLEITALSGGAGLSGIIANLLGIEVAGGKAAGGLMLARSALIQLGKATVVLALLQSAVDMVSIFSGSMSTMPQWFHFVVDSFFAVRNAIVGAGQTLAQFIGMLPGAGLFADIGREMSNYQKDLAKNDKKVHAGLDKWAASFQKPKIATREFGAATDDAATSADDFGFSLDGLTPKLGGAGNAAGGAAKQIRTLVDYTNDLSGVFARAFEIRFGPAQGLDAITSGWSKIATAAADAREEAEGYRAELMEIASDRAIKEYWLTVAEGYGDTLRAGKLRAELADLDKKQTSTTKKLTTAQDKTNKTLEGNSDAAIANRAEILGLVGNYQTYLQSLASSGMSQADLSAKSAQLRAEFMRQATQMGYNVTEVEQYASAFDDMRIAIDNVPRNITVNANTNPAMQALNEFLAKAAAASATVGIGGGDGWGAGAAAGDAYAAGWANSVNRGRWVRTNYNRPVPGGKTYNIMNGANPGPEFFKKGGYTGNMGVNQAAGVVHGQEYVFSAPAVKNLGLGNLGMLHSLGKSGKGFAPSGLAGRGGPVDLSAASLNALANVLAGRLSIVLPGAQLAASVGSHNVVSGRRGGA